MLSHWRRCRVRSNILLCPKFQGRRRCLGHLLLVGFPLPQGLERWKCCGSGNEWIRAQSKSSTIIICSQRFEQGTSFPFEDASFDKVTCVVSVDYLNKPLQVFKEIGRVLRPGGECLISMSNRWCVQILFVWGRHRNGGAFSDWIFRFPRSFPTKAFQIWLQTNDLEHIFITGSFFHYTGMFEPPSCSDISPNPGRSDPMFVVKGVRKANWMRKSST